MTAAAELPEETCGPAAQSLSSMDTSEHFQVLKLLGQGSYGRVLLALHRSTGTPMALKCFPRGSTSRRAFLREYNFSLSFCAHPSLTSALGIAYLTPSHYVFAQQAGLYGDLYDRIPPEVGMEEGCCQRVVSQLCGALSHLHSLGFVHRDVKPENVFLCDAACRWVKLGDYGMVKARGTRVPEVWYSSPYCPPEAEIARGRQLDGEDDSAGGAERNGSGVWALVEPSTDSWALGIMTYAMLTGTHPWAQTSSDCRSYQIYLQWFQQGAAEDSDVWAEPGEQVAGSAGAACENGAPAPVAVAPQFACFTPLARTFFRSLLHPRPRRRGRPEDGLSYLGGDWVEEAERARMEEGRKKSGGKGRGKVKEMEG